MDKDIDEQSSEDKQISQRLLIMILMVLFWQNADDLPNLLNFHPTCYTVILTLLTSLLTMVC